MEHPPRVWPASPAGDLALGRAADADAACRWAERLLELRLQCEEPGRLAVVLDVDHTLLVGGRGAVRPIRPVERLLNWCAARGVLCAVVTAREDFRQGRAQLEQELRAVRGADWIRAVYMRPALVGYAAHELLAFKDNCRRDVERRFKVSVALTVGDNWHDVLQAADGGAALRDLILTRHGPEAFVGLRRRGGEALLKLPAGD